jgi:TFIIF-interacting CTD phosphatase-like protein
MTVVLDMDETMCHSEFTGRGRNGLSLAQIMRQAEDRSHVSSARAPDFSFLLYPGRPEEEVVHVYKRPGLDRFLEQLSQFAEIVVFTASLALYADPILNFFDPNKRCQFRLYRDSCIATKRCPHVKSLVRLVRASARNPVGVGGALTRRSRRAAT